MKCLFLAKSARFRSSRDDPGSFCDKNSESDEKKWNTQKHTGTLEHFGTYENIRMFCCVPLCFYVFRYVPMFCFSFSLIDDVTCRADHVVLLLTLAERAWRIAVHDGGCRRRRRRGRRRRRRRRRGRRRRRRRCSRRSQRCVGSARRALVP